MNKHSNRIPPRKVLVAYASRHESTADVARVMADELSESGSTVDIRSIEGIQKLGGYDAIIIGSAIRYDKWLPEATDFVARHQSTLQQTPVSLFFTCMTLSIKSEKATAQVAEYAAQIAALLPQVSSAGVGQFAGALDFSKIPLPSRLIAKFVFAFLRVKAGDYRDWAAIRDWARTSALSPKTNHQAITKGSVR